MRSIMFCAAAAVACLSAGPAFSAPLTAAEIRERIIGPLWSWDNGDDGGTVRYTAQGEVHLTIETAAPQRDQGVWRIDGDRLCTRYPVVRGGAEECYTLSPEADGARYRASTDFLLWLGSGPGES